MSAMNITTVNYNNQGICISGTASFQMATSTTPSYVTTNATTNYVIPDFSQTIAGTLRLAEETPVIELRKVSLEEAKRLIYTYIKKHPGSRTSELIIELALDPDIVVEVLSQLKSEQRIEGKDIGTK